MSSLNQTVDTRNKSHHQQNTLIWFQRILLARNANTVTSESLETYPTLIRNNIESDDGDINPLLYGHH